MIFGIDAGIGMPHHQILAVPVIGGPRSRWFGSGAQRLEPGDVIVVQLDVTRLRPLELWTSIAAIMQSPALTVARPTALV